MADRTRRELLAAAGTGAVGALAVAIALRSSEEASATRHDPHAGHPARHATDGWKLVEQATHRGRRIELETNGKRWRCRIDRRPLHPHVFDRQADRSFSSHLLPYADPPKPLDLARALIDGEALELFRLH